MKNNNLTKLKKDIVFQEILKGYDFEFHATWGLFSPQGIDTGSRLLIDQLEAEPDDNNLDLGCGYGALGLVLARLSPAGTTHLVDKDFVAVEYAEKNARLNQLKNCQIYLSNGFSHVPDMQFDNIVANLPSRVGNELLTIIIYEAQKHLKIKGKFYVVTISRMKEFIKKSFKEVFNNYQKVKQNKNYTISLAINE